MWSLDHSHVRAHWMLLIYSYNYDLLAQWFWFQFALCPTTKPYRNVKAFLWITDAQFFCRELIIVLLVYWNQEARHLLRSGYTIPDYFGLSTAVSLCWFTLSWWSQEITRSFPRASLLIYNSSHPLFGSWSFEPKGRTCHLSLVNPIIEPLGGYSSFCFWSTKACSLPSILRR